MSRLALVGATITAFTGVVVAVGTIDLRAPWHGIFAAIAAVSFLALGAVGRWRGVALAVGAVALGVFVWSPPWTDQLPGRDGEVCDPSCGLGSVAIVVMVAPIATVLAMLGVALRAAVRRARARTPTT